MVAFRFVYGQNAPVKLILAAVGNGMRDDRRRHRRRDVAAVVKIFNPGFGSVTGRTRNIGDGGFFVELQDVPELPVGTGVKAVLPGSKNPNAVFNLQLVRREPQGMAFKIINYEVHGEVHDIHELRTAWHNEKTRA